MKGFKAGAAFRVINCNVGDEVAGMLKPRVSNRIRDNLEANALFVDSGSSRSIIINCDLLGLSRSFVDEISAKIDKRTGVPASGVIIACTHTHSGPYTKSSSFGLCNDEYLAFLERTLLELAEEAVSSAVDASAGYALGSAKIGYNRRVCWKDKTHSMYGNTADEKFAGIEGPDDPSHAVLFAVDRKGKLIGVLHNNTCHATSGCAFGYISADFPGEARKLIRNALGKNIPVLYIQGACGDICRLDQLKHEGVPDDEGLRDSERRLKEIGCTLAGETLRILRETPVTDKVEVKHEFRDIRVGIRMPTPEMLKKASQVVERGPEESPNTNNIDEGYGFQKGILKIHEEYKDCPYENVPLHALRVGGFALATVPCEMYCQFGIDVKRRSPAKVTAFSELTHGSLGYCPTIYGILGGGYSGANYYGSRLEPYAGYKMAEELSIMLYELF